MKRRFTDVDKWDPWFRSLPPEYKILWFYIHDKCDEVGLWRVDFEEASFHTRCKLDENEALKYFQGRIVLVSRLGAWWISGYVELQYKELKLPTPEELEAKPSLKHSPAKRYINLLQKHGLYDTYLANPTPSQLPVNSHEEEEEEEEEFKEEEEIEIEQEFEEGEQKKNERFWNQFIPPEHRTPSIKGAVQGGAPQSATADSAPF